MHHFAEPTGIKWGVTVYACILFSCLYVAYFFNSEITGCRYPSHILSAFNYWISPLECNSSPVAAFLFGCASFPRSASEALCHRCHSHPWLPLVTLFAPFMLLFSKYLQTTLCEVLSVPKTGDQNEPASRSREACLLGRKHQYIFLIFIFFPSEHKASPDSYVYYGGVKDKHV